MLWYTYYRKEIRGRYQVNYFCAKDLLRLLHGYRLKIAREPLDLATLRPMREVV